MDTLKHIQTKGFHQEVTQCLIGGVALVSLTVVCYRLHLNVATAALVYVIVIVLLARTGGYVSSMVASVLASFCLAHLAPPTYSFRVDDPLDVVAVAAFSIASLVVALLMSRLRRMTVEAISSVDRRLLDLEERERAWVARELHDDVNQRLALVSVGLEVLVSHISDLDSTARQSLKQIREQVSNLATDVHALSRHLHSSNLELLGIVAAAKRLCKDLSEKHVLEIELHSDGIPKSLPQNIAISLFRVLQEALQNAIKHSRSGHFVVHLNGLPGGIELDVHDAGVGFDPEAAMRSSGLGLISMQERIKLIKGEFSIASQVNSGTTIHAKVPLPS
ncbi:MAG TPA: sensor histidine kinase [Candidatus Acidoferrum sp.]|nr:sensor histidine kinase [Candidatus Acidoferrum sp.]